MLENYWPGLNPFSGQVIGQVVASKRQGFVKEMGYRDLFASSFQFGLGTETDLLILEDDPYCGLRGRSSILVILEL